MTVRFDDAISYMLNFTRDHLGAEALRGSVIIRDASGRLSMILDSAIEGARLEATSKELANKLGGYGRGEATIRNHSFPGANLILEESRQLEPRIIDGIAVRLIDRRIVGADWTSSTIRPSTKSLPRFVFASLKGGVGRSTSLAVVCAHLSDLGKRVLAIDLDLEAPGIGSLLLKPDETPRFGVIDYLVENNISGIDGTFLEECVGGSALGSLGGRVVVMPAIGTKTLDSPENALAKLARAYLEDVSDVGDRISFSDQVRFMVEAYESTGKYDVILIDARSGLHESNAAVLQNLDATVLFFASDQPQTFVGYKLLLAHLKYALGANPNWFEKYQFVHAKAASNDKRQSAAEEKLRSLIEPFVRPLLPYAEEEPQLTANDFDLEWVAEDAPSLSGTDDELDEPLQILRVLDDPRYEWFDPLSKGDLLTPEIYSGTFRSLLDFIDDEMQGAAQDEQDA